MHSAHWKYFTIFLIVLTVTNVAGLWISQIMQQQEFNKLNADIERLEKGIKTLTSTPVLTLTDSENIEATAETETTSQSVAERVTVLEEQLKDLDSQTPPSDSDQQDSTSATVKEFFVPVGTGNSSSTNWTNIPGATVTIDRNQYQSIRDVRFEAGLAILSGNAYARLVNKDTGEVFTNSEVLHNTSTPTWKTSSSFGLNNGSASYMVQLRSSSGERVDLSGARIKIVVE